MSIDNMGQIKILLCAMNVTQADIDELTKRWDSAAREQEAYFERIYTTVLGEERSADNQNRAYYIQVKPEFIAQAGKSVIDRLNEEIPSIIVRLIELSKASPVVSDVDRYDLKFILKELLASLQFRKYRHWETYIHSDEDRVLGVDPPGQAEDECDLNTAYDEFVFARAKVQRLLGLLVPSDTPEATAVARAETASVRQYRPNTAFIMMWIDEKQPELEDVKNGIKEVFGAFGIKAIRSDEIQHSDLITQRILDEISTSEFLIADLTGARTSVYYEVGYAHALKRRPILYRKADQKVGFDLAGHNCPEYKNVTDLKEKLTARLAEITNKEPKP
jgi:hypothetical protein